MICNICSKDRPMGSMMGIRINDNTGYCASCYVSAVKVRQSTKTEQKQKKLSFARELGFDAFNSKLTSLLIVSPPDECPLQGGTKRNRFASWLKFCESDGQELESGTCYWDQLSSEFKQLFEVPVKPAPVCQRIGVET